MFTALEEPGIGHREQLQPDPGGGLCIEPELIKRLPPVPRLIPVCLSFRRGALGPLWRCFGPRPCSPECWERRVVSCLSSFWVSDGSLVLLPKWARSQAET